MTDSHAEDVVQLAAEDAAVHVRAVEHGRLRVTVQTTLRDEIVDQPLTHERIEVTRVPMDRVVAEAPAVREDGDTTIISVVEEVVVVERRLVLKEEVHLRRVRTTEHYTGVVTLRAEQAVIERVNPDPDAGHVRLPTAEAHAPIPTTKEPL